MVQRVKKYRPRQWGEDCWARIFSSFRDFYLHRKKGMQARDTMRRWYTCLYEMKKKDEEKRTEVEHQKLVSRMIASADGGTGLLCTKSPSQRRGEEERRF